MSRWTPLLLVLFLWPAFVSGQQAARETEPAVGPRENPPAVHALTNARIVVEPGRVLDGATLVIRNGIVEAVGAEAPAPSDARIWDMEGRTLYPGFIDAYADVGLDELPRNGDPGPVHWTSQVRSHFDARSAFRLNAERKAALRAQGLTVAHAAPQLGVFQGSTAVVSLGETGPRAQILRPDVAQIASFSWSTELGDDYPHSLMGAVALVRQTLYDADWHVRAHQTYESGGAAHSRPEANAALAALARVARGEQPLLFASDTEEEFLRTEKIVEEFGVDLWVRGSGDEYKVLDVVARTGYPLIVPVAFPDAPEAGTRRDRLNATLAELRHWYLAPENPARLADAGVAFAFGSHGLDEGRHFLRNVQTAVQRGLDPDRALQALTTTPARLLGVEASHGTLEVGKAANVVVADGDLLSDGASVVDVWVDGIRYPVRNGGGGGGAGALPDLDLPDIWPAMEYGREEIPEQPEHVLVRGATIWTQGPQGIVENGDLLVTRGQVAEVGANLDAPMGAHVIDAEGKHITPGIIDAHLHDGRIGGRNETGNPVSPEVRIRDVYSVNQIWMYRQIAGGTTAAHVMHGSQNPVGGENQLVKLRWGALPYDAMMEGVNRTVKFALGENTKAADGRYPDTRMGHHQLIRDHFKAARDYRAEWDEWERTGEGLPPRKDLRMEAFADMLTEDLRIQAHSYRQDEILMLMRLTEEFGFRVQNFQHAVETYKVASEIAEHGAGAAVWSDWSSFKIEAYDATTYAARILHEAGVVTSLHSDNSQIGSRMNWEAAKMLRTGLDDEDALSLVTNNTARVLGVDHRIGSLEPGKDGDFVIWSGHPLSQFIRAEETWIDGRRYFSLEEDRAARERIEREREQIIDLILADR